MSATTNGNDRTQAKQQLLQMGFTETDVQRAFAARNTHEIDKLLGWWVVFICVVYFLN